MQKKASKQEDIQKVEKQVPSAATEHGFSRHTAQKSISSEEVVEDCNPYSLQLFQIFSTNVWSSLQNILTLG